MTATPDTIGPDSPRPSTDGYQQLPLTMDDCLANNRQLRRDLIAMKEDRDTWRLAEQTNWPLLRADRDHWKAEAESWQATCADLHAQLETTAAALEAAIAGLQQVRADVAGMVIR